MNINIKLQLTHSTAVNHGVSPTFSWLNNINYWHTEINQSNARLKQWTFSPLYFRRPTYLFYSSKCHLMHLFIWAELWTLTATFGTMQWGHFILRRRFCGSDSVFSFIICQIMTRFTSVTLYPHNMDKLSLMQVSVSPWMNAGISPSKCIQE